MFQRVLLSVALTTVVASPLMAAASAPYRLRLTETSVTESGRLVGEPEVELRTKGYGVGASHPSGVGFAYTMLKTTGSDGVAALRHDYLDLHYTYQTARDVLLTLGTGVAVGGDVEYRGDRAEKPRGASYFVGPGYAVGWFEVYWICRANFLRYEILTASLRHCQLGLGAQL